VSLIAREFERHGTPTLILGSALDILRSGAPPRVQFLNYPLGYTAGRPFDPENQRQVLTTALRGFDRMQQPGMERMDFEWPDGWTLVEQRSLEDSGSDLRSPRDTAPRYQTEADRLLAESKQGGIR
jgi:hypothetical protein